MEAIVIHIQILTLDHSIARYEILQSKLDIEEALGVEVKTFAYPFGFVDSLSGTKSTRLWLPSGMGLGTSWTHTWSSMFYLNRIEIHGNFSVEYMGNIITLARRIDYYAAGARGRTHF